MEGEKMLSLRKIPFKNIMAHPARAVILIILTFAQAVCVFSGIMMVQGVQKELSQDEARLGADLLVYPTAAVSRIDKRELLMQGTPVEVYRDRSMLSRMDSCDGIAAVSCQIYLSDTLEDGSCIRIVGIEPDTDFVISPWLEEGGGMDLQKGTVAAGCSVKTDADETVSLYGRKWPVAVRLLETGSSLDESVFVSMETVKDLIRASEDMGITTYSSVDPETDFSAALVRVNDRDEVESVTDWINIYVRKVTAVRSEETLTKTASGIRGTTDIMAVIAVAAWIVLLAALGITQALLMKERVKEIHVWHCVGASRGIVSRVMLTEALLVHLAGAVSGVLPAAVLYAVLGGQVFSGIKVSAGGLLIAALTAAAVTVAAGIFSAFIALKRVSKKMNGQMLTL